MEMVDGTKLKPIRPFLPHGFVRQPERQYSTFLEWRALRVKRNREEKSAEWLQRVDVYVYLPLFKRSCCRRGGLRYRRNCAVLPGLLFVPDEMLDIENREEVFDWAQVYGFVCIGGGPICLSKADIEVIRRIDAKLNKPDHPVDARGNEIAEGQRARFIDPRAVRLFGEATVFEVARDNRIGVEVGGLFGGQTKMYVTADEIEVM